MVAELSREELLAALVDRDGVIAELTSALAGVQTTNGLLVARVTQLERLLGKDSSTSSRPPSSDLPYRKPKRTSSRIRSGRKPGKQPGDPGTTLRQVEVPDKEVPCEPEVCDGCGNPLGDGAELVGVARRQVFDVPPPPPLHVTEYQLRSRRCTCGRVSTGTPPAWVNGPVQYGPELLAHTALVTCGHYVPVERAAQLLAAGHGARVSTGFVAGVRARAAARLDETFMPRVRELLRTAGVLHVDETPGRVSGGMSYVHVACTDYLTSMHTGDRSAATIDAGGVLPGYTGVIMRDGYAGYVHLKAAEHAWCCAHLLRDLRSFHTADPHAQQWAHAMARTLADAHHAAQAARAAGQDSLDQPVLATIRKHYQGAVAKGLTDNATDLAGLQHDALTLARRFRDHETMILRFCTDLTVPWTNNEAERTCRPVKVQQRTSGGCWRTLEGIAQFAIVQSYLSTARKWGLDQLDVLRQLFTTGPWLPPALAPT